jgi:hypothetical protein
VVVPLAISFAVLVGAIPVKASIVIDTSFSPFFEGDYGVAEFRDVAGCACEGVPIMDDAADVVILPVFSHFGNCGHRQPGLAPKQVRLRFRPEQTTAPSLRNNPRCVVSAFWCANKNVFRVGWGGLTGNCERVHFPGRRIARVFYGDCERPIAPHYACVDGYALGENEGAVSNIAASQGIFEGVVSLFKSDPLKGSNDGKRNGNQGSSEQTSYRPIFSAALAAFGTFLFSLIGFKFVRKGLDSDDYSLLCFIGALASVVCAALCLVYSLINLLDCGSQIRRQHPLTAFNRRTENVIIKAVIIAELELSNVKMQVSFADIVECPHNSALKDAPEAFNRVGVHGTDHVLALVMVDL